MSRFDFDYLEPRRLLSANVDPRFGVLVAEYEAYLAGGAQGEFQPSDTTVIVDDGRVWIEAFFWTDRSDEQRIHDTFDAAGFEDEGVNSLADNGCLSGWMPITSLKSPFYDATDADEIWGLEALPELGGIDSVDAPLLTLEEEYRAYLENPVGEFTPRESYFGGRFLILPNGKVGVDIYLKALTPEAQAALDSLGYSAQYEQPVHLVGWLPMTAASSLPSVPGFLSAHQLHPGITHSTFEPLPEPAPVDPAPTAPTAAAVNKVAPSEWSTSFNFKAPIAESDSSDDADPLDLTTA